MLYIVVPTFNRIKVFLKFIEQLKSQTCQTFKLIVVDHGRNKTGFSDAGTVVIESDVNGWSYAINVGIRYVLEQKYVTDNDYIMVMNDDVIMKDDFIENTIKAINEKPNAVLSSIAYDWNTNKLLHVNMQINYKKALFEYYYKGEDISSLTEKYYPTDVMKGRGTVWPVKILKDIGIYNEKKLPHYKADHELAWRAKCRGYEVLIAKNMQLGAILDSPHTIDRSKSFIENYMNIFHHMISVQNAKDLRNYAFCSFSPLYACYFWGVNWLRQRLFFIYTFLKQ